MRPFNGCIDSDMNKAILTSISLFVAACGILIARRVCVHGPVRYASSVTLAPSEAPTLKEWINNSIDEDCPPGDLLRYHPMGGCRDKPSEWECSGHEGMRRDRFGEDEGYIRRPRMG